jgi:hypothetical protein
MQLSLFPATRADAESSPNDVNIMMVGLSSFS